jgi:putative glutamine amidotransferase
MLKIGVTSCFFYPDVKRTVFGPKSLNYLEVDMANYLAGKDIMPIMIPDLKGESLNSFLSEMDGLVFQGGSDLSPKSYDEPFLNEERWPGDYYRDQYELKIMDYAFKNKKPVFGICRGFQLVNTYFKGKLYQDLETETKTTVKHRDAIEYDRVQHLVRCEEDSLLKKLYNKDEIKINSVHHQGLKILGDDLIVEARCTEDNLVEAFRYNNMDENYIYCVQWHPEFSHTLIGSIDPSEVLYDMFINRIRKDNENN